MPHSHCPSCHQSPTEAPPSPPPWQDRLASYAIGLSVAATALEYATTAERAHQWLASELWRPEPQRLVLPLLPPLAVVQARRVALAILSGLDATADGGHWQTDSRRIPVHCERCGQPVLPGRPELATPGEARDSAEAELARFGWGVLSIQDDTGLSHSRREDARALFAPSYLPRAGGR